MNRYEFYPGDYLKDTLGLSMVEDGAYRRLLDHYYSTEQPVEDGEKFRVTRAMDKAEREATQRVLVRFFARTGSVWVHRKVEQEIEKAMPKVEAARQNGRKGGRPPKEKPSGFPVGSETGTQTEPKANPEPKLPAPAPVPIEDDPPKPPTATSGKIPCPPGLQLTEGQLAQLEMGIGLPQAVATHWTPVVRARLVTMDPMPPASWQRALTTALVRDWQNRRDEMLGKAPERRGGPRRGPVQPNPTGRTSEDFLRSLGASDEELAQMGFKEATT